MRACVCARASSLSPSPPHSLKTLISYPSQDLITIFECAVVELENGIRLGAGRQGTPEGPPGPDTASDKDHNLFIRFLYIVLHFLMLMTCLLKYFR